MAHLIDCPNKTPPESAYMQVYEYLAEKQLGEQIVSSVLHASRAFEHAQEHKLALAPLIHNAVDIEGEFAAARAQGASERKLLGLSRRLMAARTVLSASREYERAIDELGLTRIGKEDWLREARIASS